MGRKLFVGNLSYNVGEAELHALFERIGTVDTVTIMRDLATGRARGFAFVEVRTEDDARRVASALNDAEVGGRKLTVNEPRPRPAFTGGGGNGSGGGSRR